MKAVVYQAPYRPLRIGLVGSRTGSAPFRPAMRGARTVLCF